MTLPIRWRDLSTSGLEAWGNATLNERVLDLLANILFAVDEIRDMVELEHGFPPFEGFDGALSSIYEGASGVMQRLGTRRRDAPEVPNDT